jgi:putative CocE/NonD family hydrolase
LSWSSPAAAISAFDQYVSDPNKPVPFIGYIDIGMPAEHMVGDQRFAMTRPDVISYQTDVLEDDVTLAGPVSPRLFVSTSGTDSDWVVKLIDVYPPELDEASPGKQRDGVPRDVQPPVTRISGYQQLVRGNPLRARYRKGFEHPMASVPGKVELIRFDMPDVLHTFRRGHRVMVQIQSSWFPMFDRNPQTFVSIKDARPADFQAATQKIFKWREQPSGVEVRVLSTFAVQP